MLNTPSHRGHTSRRVSKLPYKFYINLFHPVSFFSYQTQQITSLMTIFNLGSINIDYTYQIPHLPRAGETLTSTHFSYAIGGKGLNQSLSLIKAGADVTHIGAVNPQDTWILKEMSENNLRTDHVQHVSAPTGHAIIYVNSHGENQIILHPGANHSIDINDAQETLMDKEPSDWALLQNETTGALEFAKAARALFIPLAYNAAPFLPKVTVALIPYCDILIVNHHEATEIAKELQVDRERLSAKLLNIRHLIITDGANGVTYQGEEGTLHQPAFPVEVKDTTGAGDCFCGFFMAEVSQKKPFKDALRMASAAAALHVTKHGAASSPSRAEVEAFLKNQGRG